MSIQRLKNADGSFLLSKILTDVGTHTFTVGQTSGNVQVSASPRVNVVLSDGSTSLNQGTGTDFVVGAANFDNIAIEAFEPDTSVALRLIGAETSTAGSVPSWYDQVGYVMGGRDRGGANNLTNDKYLATARTWSVGTPLPVTAYQSRGCSNQGVAGYLCNGDMNGVNYSDDVQKYDYSTSTWSDLSSVSTPWRGRDTHSVFWERGANGYVCNGGTTGQLSTADKVAFATDTFSTISNANYSRSVTQFFHHRANNTGYSWGGYDGANNADEWMMLDMSSDTWSHLANQGSARREAGTVVEEAVAAFTAGDNTFTSQSITRHPYPSTSGSTVCYIAAPVQSPVPLSFDTHGLWAGGWNGDERNYVQTFEFATTTNYISTYVNAYLSPSGEYGGANAADGGMSDSHRNGAGFWDV